jgi:RNA polymerase sigma-70 factor (ECF subfamily)
LHKGKIVMQTAGEIGIFQRDRAEVPHHAVTIALTDTATLGGEDVARGAVESGTYVDPLVERAKAGDGTALNELLVAMRPRAMAAALRILHNRDDAEDAVQDAFLKVWRCLAAFEGRSSFSTWIHRIVSNASLDVMRRNSSRSETAERTNNQDVTAAADCEPCCDRTPETELGAYEIQMLVRTAVAALPVAHRQAVELREFEDCSYQEMAEIIHCPVGTVMSRLHHARGRLASDLREPLGGAFERCAA